MSVVDLTRTAVISDDGVYRYRLGRHWAPEGDVMAFIMLNPSTADVMRDDPTIRRCVGFARREDCVGIEVLNLYALRSSDPSELRRRNGELFPTGGSEGYYNARHWADVLNDHRVAYIVAAWGAGVPKDLTPSRALAGWHRSGWFCLGKTKAGEPRHPLYVKADQELVML